MINPSFIPVGGGSIPISDIKVEGAGGAGDENMQNMLPDGTWANITYYYLTIDGTGYVDDGWYRDIDGLDPVDETDVLSFGHGMSLSSGSDLTLTYSGAVTQGDPIVSWDAGSGYLGNPTPVRQLFSEILVEGAGGAGDENCQKMLPNGQWDEITYYYLTMDGTGYVEDGWYRDIDGLDPVDDTDYLEPGEAISMTTTDNDLTITFKKVLD